MKRARIGLIVDQPQRDLAALVLTAFELCQKGVTCYLIPANLRATEIWALMPDFVLLFNLRRGFERLVNQLVQARIQVGLLDTEGGVWANLDDYTELLMTDQQLRQKVSCVCAWGPKVADHLTSRGQFLRSQMVVTGCPRFDFYDPMWRSVLEDSTPPGASAGKSRILINTNYTEANPRFVPVDEMIRHLCSVLGWSRSRAMRVINSQVRAIDYTIVLAANLARDYPQSTVVIRPHPFEGTDVYRSRLDGLSNVEVNVTGSVQAQIFRASVVIQRTSTTAIETNLARIPALSPQWIPSEVVMPVVEAVSVPCLSYKEMRLHIDAIMDSKYSQPARIREAVNGVIENWFFRIDGLAHKRVSDIVLSQLEGAGTVDEKLCRKYLYGIDGEKRAKPQMVGRRVRYMLGLTPDWQFRRAGPAPPPKWMETDQFYDESEVAELVEKVDRARQIARHGGRSVVVGPAGAYAHLGSHSIRLSCDQ